MGEGFGEPEHHVLTILYDHRSRPLTVVDDNLSTELQETWQYFWTGSDLLHLIHTPSSKAPTTYDIDTYVPLQPMLLGRVLTQYSGGEGTGEEWMYYATGPLGQPVAGYSFDISTLATSEVWRMDRSPFGERLSETTYDASRYRPPHLFPGQLVLPGSEVGWWNEGEYELSRAALWMNMWRVYDARVGQYLQPEPLLTSGELADRHGYGYVRSSPLDLMDPNGLQDTVTATCGPGRQPEVCAAIRELPKRGIPRPRPPIIPDLDVDPTCDTDFDPASDDCEFVAITHCALKEGVDYYLCFSLCYAACQVGLSCPGPGDA